MNCRHLLKSLRKALPGFAAAACFAGVSEADSLWHRRDPREWIDLQLGADRVSLQSQCHSRTGGFGIGGTAW